ncbi:MAG: metallophosphoesterase family protein [Promethearchaeota archaeon]
MLEIFLRGEENLRILHTADLHLQEKNIESLRSLELLIELAKVQQIDLLTIGGDLFNSPTDADSLRTRVRNIFNDLGFPVIAIPGNHDKKVFKGNLFYGNDFHALTTEPLTCYTPEVTENVNIIGVPFTERVSDELIFKLKENQIQDAVNILLLHCTLDISFSKDDFGDEDEIEYCLIDKATLNGLGYDFVLAGHFHTRFDHRRLGSSCEFVYPGSPVSLSWKEVGDRGAALIDTVNRKIDYLPLKGCFCREIYPVEVKIGSEEECLHQVNILISESKGKKGEFLAQIEGIGEMDEIEFNSRIDNQSGIIKINNNYRSVKEIIDHSLYKLFKEEIERSDPVNDREILEKRMIEALGFLIRE